MADTQTIKPKRRLPFQGMQAAQWQNLGIAALIAVYLLVVLLDVARHNTFGGLGSDFASYWSAGYIANHFGYAQVYDLPLMTRIQAPLYPRETVPIPESAVIPTPYLPVFIIPFQVLALLPPVAAFWVWTAANALGFFLYLRFLLSKLPGDGPISRPLVLAMASLPVFLNLFYGQANLLLLISVGEFLRMMLEGKPFRAGLWLGGLLLKPQSLVLIGLALLLQRSVKALAGLACSGAAIGLASLALAGPRGLMAVFNLWLGYAGGLSSNNPEAMMNWRMLGMHLSRLANPVVGWSLAVSGMLATLLAAALLWRGVRRADGSTFVVALAGTLAATGLLAWHSHAHMAVILLPPLLYLYRRHYAGFRNMLVSWVLLPGLGYFVELLAGVFGKLSGMPPGSAILLSNFIHGAALFGFNIYILAWAATRPEILLFRRAVSPRSKAA